MVRLGLGFRVYRVFFLGYDVQTSVLQVSRPKLPENACFATYAWTSRRVMFFAGTATVVRVMPCAWLLPTKNFKKILPLLSAVRAHRGTLNPNPKTIASTLEP